MKRIAIGGLRPGRPYRVSGAEVQEVQADREGKALLEIALRERTEVRLSP
ncbi:MAG: hypothetical protein HUJ31_05090 [Pseudomonadales bacterium]|nr:hypothetical protein [Pseudomonadales bacterium]